MAEPRKLMATAEEALGALDVAGLDDLNDGELDGFVTALARLRATIDRLWVRTGAVAEQRQLHRRHGQRDTASWLAAVSGARPGVARRDITGEEARRLAHDANITRVITRGRSEVLDLGRTTRAVSTALAKAVIARDRHCRYVGRTSPPWACEIHHRQPWAQGGPTTLANLGLLCWHHHHLVHDRTDQLTDTSDHRWQLVPIGRAA